MRKLPVVLRNSQKANGSTLRPPPPPNRRHGKERERGGKRGHRVTYVISVKKLDICHISDWSACPSPFRLRVEPTFVQRPRASRSLKTSLRYGTGYDHFADPNAPNLRFMFNGVTSWTDWRQSVIT
ncbi:hypothetical protein TNCV_2061011 [Trichonephila clavipes]|nr:hypothetical protein TNCV_2061011 [Trichonephila clavipes]